MYNGIFPVYDTPTDVMKPVEALGAMMNTSPTAECVCQEKPIGITKPAVFLINIALLSHLKADDLGSWIHKGKPVHYYEVERSPESGEVMMVSHCNKQEDPGTFKFTRVYYHHKATPEFRKTLFFCTW